MTIKTFPDDFPDENTLFLRNLLKEFRKIHNTIDACEHIDVVAEDIKKQGEIIIENLWFISKGLPYSIVPIIESKKDSDGIKELENILWSCICKLIDVKKIKPFPKDLISRKKLKDLTKNIRDIYEAQWNISECVTLENLS